MKFPWIMHMEWRDLLFMHWPVRSASLARCLPGGVDLDTFEGQAWLGVLPFAVTGFRPRGIPLGLSYGQVNVRTYVRVNGVPGIWTFSLDAASGFSVLGARWLYCLPYFAADIHLHAREGWLQFGSVRRSDVRRACALMYRPVGRVFHAHPGTLEYWLTERRVLFTVGWNGGLWREDVQHEPWPLQRAEIRELSCTLHEPLGLLTLGVPLAHYARVVRVRGWPPKVAAGSAP